MRLATATAHHARSRPCCSAPSAGASKKPRTESAHQRRAAAVRLRRWRHSSEPDSAGGCAPQAPRSLSAAAQPHDGMELRAADAHRGAPGGDEGLPRAMGASPAPRPARRVRHTAPRRLRPRFSLPTFVDGREFLNKNGEAGMFEALRCVRGTKALNFNVFLIPNLAHPLIRWVPEEPGSSPHGVYGGKCFCRAFFKHPVQRVSADMTFRNPESESDFHFPSPELVNHSHGFYSVPGNYHIVPHTLSLSFSRRYIHTRNNVPCVVYF